MFNSKNFKFNNMRKEQSFVVYPFKKGTNEWIIQSETRIAKINRDGKMLLSKSFSNGAYFVHLSNTMGAEIVETPNEIMKWLLELDNNKES